VERDQKSGRHRHYSNPHHPQHGGVRSPLQSPWHHGQRTVPVSRQPAAPEGQVRTGLHSDCQVPVDGGRRGGGDIREQSGGWFLAKGQTPGDSLLSDSERG